MIDWSVYKIEPGPGRPTVYDPKIPANTRNVTDFPRNTRFALGVVVGTGKSDHLFIHGHRAVVPVQEKVYDIFRNNNGLFGSILLNFVPLNSEPMRVVQSTLTGKANSITLLCTRCRPRVPCRFNLQRYDGSIFDNRGSWFGERLCFRGRE
jgi:hypothetical protein